MTTTSNNATDALRDEVRRHVSILDVVKARGIDLRKSGREWIGRCPFHDDKSPSFRVNPAKDGGVWRCDPCDEGGDAIRLVERLDGSSFSGALRRIAADHGIEVPKPREAAVYRYTDGAGVVLGVKRRWEPAHDGSGKRKSFTWEGPDGRRGQPKPWAPTLYRAPAVVAAIAEGRTVLVVEGEKCADALGAVGFVATTNENGAGTWKPEHAQHLRGAHVVVLPDNDEPGRSHAATVLRSLRGVATSARMVEVPGLPPKGDVVDYLATHSAADLQALLDDEATMTTTTRQREPGDDDDLDDEGDAWADPVPLDGHGELPAFPLGALPDALRAWVEATSTALQIPPDLAAFCALGALAACVQGRLEAEVWPGWIEVLGLYGEVLLSSGNRKSAGFRSAVAPLAEIEAEKARELAGEIKDARALRRVAERRLERAEKNAAASDAGPNAEADVCAAVQALDAAAVPVVPRWIIDDSTPEAMVFALRDQGGAIALLSAEGDGLVTSMGRYSEEANLGPLLAGHAGDTYRRDRVKEGQSIVIPKVTMTVLLAVQPCTLAALAPHAGRGLPARFLYSLPNDVLGHRLDRTAAVPPRVAARYREIIRHLANIPAKHDDAGMLVPRTIHFSDGARQILEDYHHEIEPRLAGDLEPIQAWASKLRGSLVRVAALSHLVDAEDHGASPVSEEAMQRTMLLADYLIAHSVAAHALMHASGPQVDAATILRAVRRAGLLTVTERDLLRLCRGLDRDRRDEAIEVLLERGWLRKTAVRHPSSGGPPTVTFTVYPGTSAADPDRLSRLSLPPSVSTVTDPDRLSRLSLPPSVKSAADTLSVALVPSVPSSPEPVAESLSRSIPVHTTPPGQTGQTIPASEGDLWDTFLQGQP